MEKFKSILGYIDTTVMVVWGFNTFEIIQSVLLNITLININGIVKLSFSIVGLIYLIIRVYWFHKNNSTNHKLKEKDLKK